MPDPGVHAAHATLQQQLVLGAVEVLRQRHWHADGQGQHAAEVRSVPVVVLQPSDLGTFVAVLRLQRLVARQIQRYRVAEKRACGLRICTRPVFVDLVPGVIVGDHDEGFHELLLLQAGVALGHNDPTPRVPLCLAERATFHWHAVKVLVVVFGEVAVAELVHHFVVPLVLAALPFDQLGDALRRPAPEQLPAIFRQEILVRGFLRAGRKFQACRHVAQEATFRWLQLVKVAHQNRVDAGKGSHVSVLVQLPGIGRRHDCAHPLLHLCQKPGVHHADLVDDQPAPVGQALRRVAAGRLIREGADAEPGGAVQGLAGQVRSIRGLKGSHFVLDALSVPEHAEELVHGLEDPGLAGARPAVQEPHQGLVAFQDAVLWVE